MTIRKISETWRVRILALLVALMGAINILSAVSPGLPQRLSFLEKYSPLSVRALGHLAAVLAGFALLILARNLLRRKHLAWLVTEGVLAVSAVSHLLKGLDYEEAFLATTLWVALYLQRYHFHAASDRPSIRQGIRILAGSILFTIAYGITGFYLLDRHNNLRFDLLASLRQTVVMFTQFYDPGLVSISGFGRYFGDSLYVVGTFSLLFALLMLLRPVLVRPTSDLEQRQLARKIVERFGRSVLARFILFDDKIFYFSAGGSVIGYTARGRVAVALGDPIGPAEDVFSSITEFSEFCAKNDWLTAFYQVTPEYLPYYKKIGFEILCIGNEAIINLLNFTLAGKEAKDMRTALNRMKREGFLFQVYQPPITKRMLGDLRTISDEWLATMHGAEKRFSLGWFDDSYLRDCLIATVQNTEGLVVAFANLIPEFKKSEIGIDLMRHREAIPNGVMDFLFASLFIWAQEQGFESFNLGLSPLSGVGEKPRDPALERLLHFVYNYANQFYNFKGLHSYKEKFKPTWEPRYLIFPNSATLPAVLSTLLRAHSSENLFWNRTKIT